MLRHGTTGVWFVGARGSVATTSMVGIAALSDDRSDRTGLVTALPIFDTVALSAFGELIAGGHELTSTPLVKRAEAWSTRACSRATGCRRRPLPGWS